MLIVLAQDTDAIQPAVQKAVDEGIPVIGYDRLIENPKAFYITFDNKQVGVLEAQAVFAAQPKGNYVIIKGNSADPNADFLRGGIEEVIGAAVKSGDIKIVGETYTDNWDPANAQKEMEQFLTVNNNNVDAVVCENDGMAGGVVAALAAQGLAGQVPVSGQDGDHAALNRVALGTQTVSVWKDARALGKAAGEVAARACFRQDDGRDRRIGDVQRRPQGRRHALAVPEAEPDHQGQPQRGDRRRLDHEGRGLQRRAGGYRRRLRLTTQPQQALAPPPKAAQVLRSLRTFLVTDRHG